MLRSARPVRGVGTSGLAPEGKAAYNGRVSQTSTAKGTENLEEVQRFSRDYSPSGVHKPLKVSYTHIDMIDFLIANPHVDGKTIAARYGYTEAWVSRIITSDAFQAQLAARRNEIVNPELIATVEERFRALTTMSLQRLMGELDKPACKPEVMLRAAELGAKSLGIGGHAVPAAPPTNLDDLAKRIISLNRPQEHVINGTAQRIEESEESGLGPSSEDLRPEEPLRDEPGEGAGSVQAYAGGADEASDQAGGRGIA